MAEYIERDAAMLTPVLPKEYRQYQTENLDDAYEQGWLDALGNLKNAPAADVAPVIHARWVQTSKGVIYCFNCGAVCGIGAHIEEVTEDQYFCYYCGAKMDEEDARE